MQIKHMESQLQGLREFGKNHTKFEITIKATGKKEESFNDTSIQETIKINKETYSKIITLLEKVDQ